METMKKANEAVQRFFSRYGKTAATLLVFFMLGVTCTFHPNISPL